jgi:hypothetical protein
MSTFRSMYSRFCYAQKWSSWAGLYEPLFIRKIENALSGPFEISAVVGSHSRGELL